MKFVNVVWWSSPIGVIGVVWECGLTKILMNVRKCLSGISSGDLAELTVDGTFLIPFENFASAWSFVVRYLTSAQAASRCLPPFGMPIIVPLTAPPPYSCGLPSATGIGAVPYWSSGGSFLTNAQSHAPSSIIARLPVSHACEGAHYAP